MLKTASVFIFALLTALPVLAADKGIPPRSDAAAYGAHTEAGGAQIGATLLKAEHVKDVFTADLNRCCIVVEVGVYPRKGEPVELHADDFVLRLNGSDKTMRAESPAVLANSISRSDGSAKPQVHGSVGIGYGIGGGGVDPRTGGRDPRYDPRSDPTQGPGSRPDGSYDPATGQPSAGGLSASTSVGVGIGGQGDTPDIRDREREMNGIELHAKALPDGKISRTVAGFLYFPYSGKRKKKAAYTLEYKLNGETVTLQLR